MKNHNQRSCTHFLRKYGGISLYDVDFEKINTIDDEEINLVNKYFFVLIGNLYNPEGTSTYHEYFFIHDYLFGIVI